MSKKRIQDSNEELIIQYLKKNKNFFLEYPELIKILNFPTTNKNSSKVVDLNYYRSHKLKKDYEKLKNQIKLLLKITNSNNISQQRILKTSLKVLNVSSIQKLINVILNDFSYLLSCDYINCFFTSNKILHKNIIQIDNKLATNFFKDKPQTYLNQSSKGIPIFFPNKVKYIQSYMLLKIIYGSDRFYLALGSKNSIKFNKNQKVDLIEYLIQIIQIKLTNLN